jgi:hypothetical protein
LKLSKISPKIVVARLPSQVSHLLVDVPLETVQEFSRKSGAFSPARRDAAMSLLGGRMTMLLQRMAHDLLRCRLRRRHLNRLRIDDKGLSNGIDNVSRFMCLSWNKSKWLLLIVHRLLLRLDLQSSKRLLLHRLIEGRWVHTNSVS